MYNCCGGGVWEGKLGIYMNHKSRLSVNDTVVSKIKLCSVLLRVSPLLPLPPLLAGRPEASEESSPKDPQDNEAGGQGYDHWGHQVSLW